MSNLEVPQQRPARPPRSSRRPLGVSRTPSPAPTDLTPPSGSDGDPNESRDHFSSKQAKNIFSVPLPSSYIPDRQSSLILRPEAKPSVPSRASSLTVQQQQEQERLRQSNASQRSSSNKSGEKRNSLWQSFQSLKRTSTQSQSQRSDTRKRNTLSLFNFPRKAISSSNLRKPSMSSLPTSPASTSAASPFAIPQRFSSIATDSDQIPTINEDPIKDIHDDWAPIQAWLSNVEPVKEEDEAKGERQSLASKKVEESADNSMSNYSGNDDTLDDQDDQGEQEVLLDVADDSRDYQKTPTNEHRREDNIENNEEESYKRTSIRQQELKPEQPVERRLSSLYRDMTAPFEETSEPVVQEAAEQKAEQQVNEEAEQKVEQEVHQQPEQSSPQRKQMHESKMSVEERQLPLHFHSASQSRASNDSDRFQIPRKPIRDSDLSVMERQLPLHFNSVPQARMSIESQQQQLEFKVQNSTSDSSYSHESGTAPTYDGHPQEEVEEVEEVEEMVPESREQGQLAQLHDDSFEDVQTPTDSHSTILPKALSSVRTQSNPPSAEQTPDTKDIELPVPPAREEQLYSLVHPLYSPQMAYASHVQRPLEEGVDENKRMTLSYGDILGAEEVDNLYDNGGYAPHTLQPSNIPSPKYKTHSPYLQLEENAESDLMTIEDSLQGFHIDNAIGQAY